MQNVTTNTVSVAILKDMIVTALAQKQTAMGCQIASVSKNAAAPTPVRATPPEGGDVNFNTSEMARKYGQPVNGNFFPAWGK